MDYGEELLSIPLERSGAKGFYYHNSMFGPGDAEAYYSMIRRFRPKRIIEIGGGNSTLIAHLAVTKNSGRVEHICVEPFEQSWLENLGLSQVIRSKVEDLPWISFRAFKETISYSSIRRMSFVWGEMSGLNTCIYCLELVS